jgi:hypothetical protein
MIGAPVNCYQRNRNWVVALFSRISLGDRTSSHRFRQIYSSFLLSGIQISRRDSDLAWVPSCISSNWKLLYLLWNKQGKRMIGHCCCAAVRSRRPISLNFCGSVAERKTQYARLTKLYLQPLNSDRAGIAISLWAAEMPAHATRKFMCLEARILLLNSLWSSLINILYHQKNYW